ncbi:MAG: DNA cytosine methyltransferase [Thermoguttaceae bacterium]|nr:DNA cytosine methyltransferase [Thermoguttaceae bacterium]MBR5757972.1 DNA cytosine methyltransferase [Thermoguttaceae bacterium]
MKVVDLFAGCGGMSLGFQNAGFEVVAAFERWDAAAKCYRANFDHPVFQTDLSDVSGAVAEIKKFKPDVIIGGPPCQDFSHAGKRIEASRANLTESYASIVSEIRPKCFVMENVDLAMKSRAYASARKIFKRAGYGLTEIVLNASLCGAPQKRKRFICFGMQGQKDGFASEAFTSRFSKKPMTLRDYFGNSLGFEYYYRHPRNYSRRAVFSIDEPAPTMRGVNRPVPKGYPGHPNDPCPVSPDLHVLTSPERAWIQTFPKDFKWVGTKTEVEQMIGNAVPVNLGKFVAETVKIVAEATENK